MNNLCYNIHMEGKEDASIFGKNLTRIRKDKGYTQAKLAELSGVSQRAIAHYEKYAKRPSVEKVNMLADALNVSIDELMGTSQTVKKKKDEELSYSIMKRVRVIESLPKRDRDMIFSLINTLAEKNKLRKK